MHTNKDYSKSPSKNFDAVEDIKSWLGARKFNKVSPGMAKITHPNQFSFYCMVSGIEGFPVQAWYDLYHGEGAFLKAVAEVEAQKREVLT